MKTKSKVLLVLFLLVVLMSTTIFATDATPTAPTQLPEDTQISEGEGQGEGDGVQAEDVSNTDRYFIGENIEMSELVNGNVYIIGKNVTITGSIAGDLFVIAENLNIDADVGVMNVFAVASEITMRGEIYDTYVVCDKLNFEFEGYIHRDLKAFATEVNLNGIVVKDSYIEADKVTIQNFLTGGNLKYTAQSDAIYVEVKEDGSTEETTTIPEKIIEGETTYTHRSKKIFNKEIKKVVNEIIKANNVTKETSEEKVKAIFTSYLFNTLGINANSETTKGVSKTITVPAVAFYIGVLVIIALVVAIILPIVLKNKDKISSALKKDKNKNEDKNI